jgi:hypothetical protein
MSRQTLTFIFLS